MCEGDQGAPLGSAFSPLVAGYPRPQGSGALLAIIFSPAFERWEWVMSLRSTLSSLLGPFAYHWPRGSSFGLPQLLASLEVSGGPSLPSFSCLSVGWDLASFLPLG